MPVLLCDGPFRIEGGLGLKMLVPSADGRLVVNLAFCCSGGLDENKLASDRCCPAVFLLCSLWARLSMFVAASGDDCRGQIPDGVKNEEEDDDEDEDDRLEQLVGACATMGIRLPK